MKGGAVGSFGMHREGGKPLVSIMHMEGDFGALQAEGTMYRGLTEELLHVDANGCCVQ